MKPNFALNFTDTSLGLLHRTSRGWLEVGTVGFDEPDLGKALSYLRGSALGLEPRGMTTKLVIPNSQIRYMTLAAPGPDAAARRAQIREALEGKTPYAVDDLVFDWSGTGPTVQVAVVARETLDEAETFAHDNRFNAVSFVAIPEPGSFGGEPWFGPSSRAAALLAEGEKVERDQDAIKIVGRASAKAEAEPAPPAAPRPAPAAEPVPAAEVPAPVGDNRADAAPQPETAQGHAPLPEEVVAQASVTEAEPAPAPPVEATRDADVPVEPVVARAVTARVTDSVIPEPVDPLDEDLADVPPLPAARITAAVRAAEAAQGRARPGDAARKTAAAPARTAAPKPAPAASASKPGSAATPPKLTALPGGARGSAPPPSARIVPVEADWPLERVAAAARTGKAEAARSGPMVTAPAIPLPRDRKLTVVPPPEAAPKAEAVSAKGRSEAETMTVFGARKARNRGKPRYLFLVLVALLVAILAAVFLWSAIVQASRDAEEPALATAPDVTAPETAAIAADPAVASPGDPATDAPSASPVPDLAEPEAQADAATVEPEAAADLAAIGREASTDPVAIDPEATADSDATEPQPLEDAAATEPDAAADPAAAAPPPAPRPEPAPLDGAALSDATGAAETSREPGNDPQDEIFLAQVENRVSTSDAVALQTPVTATDALPGAQPLPPPFGTLYQFDAQGRIVPTPEGVITPEGVRLVAGKPPLVPPERPAPPAPAVVVDAAASAEPVVAEPAPVFADPALAGARPRLRPANLAPEAASPETATEDNAGLTAADTTRVTSLKPRARPPELLARGDAALAERSAQASASAQAAAASLVAGLDDGTASPLAVSVSRKPAARPRTLDRSIEAAVQLAAADASLVPDTALTAPAALAPVEPPPAPVAKPEPIAKAPTLRLPKEEPAPSDFSKEEANDPAVVELDEPETGGSSAGTAAKSIVAKKATYANALNMSKISLIGVFGSPSNRYAMVRQPGGRFVKVEVGDRIDGGRVAAISQREVSYVKNGQTHTLSMPRG